MNSRPDLEIKISEKLKTLSAEHMQRLAEEYVRIRYPERFPRFEFRAFSAEGKSRAGWPDALVVHDGRIDGVEATIAKDRGDVKKHILMDIEKARQKRPSMAGFVFISGHPDVQFKAKELVAFKQGFAKAGVPRKRCELIFGMSLARELAKPEFALLRHGILKLPITPKKFFLFVPKLEWESRQLLFIPTAEDYLHGRVHRPQAADEVSSFLGQTGLVLVRGIGASGKTVMARLLALDREKLGLPSYYLDLARFDERQLSGGELSQDMNDFGGQGVLFILDNIHLNELVASELASHWESLPLNQRPNLLLLGRELRSGCGSSIAGLEIPVIPLKARQPEVLGVYRRLAGRDNAPDFVLPQPPPEVLDQWVATFGGDPYAPDTTTDLIAFSAAVLDQLPALMKGHWTLTEQHAVDAIRVHYLDKLGPEETNNLMRLAALAELEFSLDQETLADQRAAFKTASHRLGLVFQDKAGAHTRYRLAHAALGRLLLKASYNHVDVAKEQRASALAHPFSGFAIARRLQTLGHVDQAKSVLAGLMERPESLLEVGGCQYLFFAIRQIQRLETADLADISSVLSLAGNHGRLVQMVFATPLGDLRYFLAYVEQTKALQSVFVVMTEALAEPGNRQDLVLRALASPLDHLKTFLAYAEETNALKSVFAVMAEALAELSNREAMIRQVLSTPLSDLKTFLAYAEETKALKSVFAVMAEALAEPRNRQDLVLRALASTLGYLKTFLAYAERTKALKPVFADVVNALAKLSNREALIRQVLATPLSDLKDFLAYAEETKTLKPVFGDVVNALAELGTREILIRQALATPLDSLKTFLEYAAQAKALKPTFIMLLSELKKPENSKILAKRFVTAPLDQLVAIQKAEPTAELWQTVIGAVDAAEWRQDRLLEVAPKVEPFISFQKYAVAFGKSELAAAPALNMVRRPSRQVWHTSGIGLHHLSHVLRCADEVSPEETARFLDSIATADWLDEQIGYGANAGVLAGALLSLATLLPVQQRRYFLRPSLEQRVRRELAACRPGDYLAWACAISLLGAAALLGLRIETIQLPRLETMDLSAIVELRKPQPERSGIGPFQVQLWMGLRELARLYNGLDAISATEAEPILERWREADTSETGQTLPPFIRQNNVVMIAWLERCQAEGWRLLP